jgi:type II secretory ATPase GspE/PulE/Tfp pilus assembly ATPase PilB-like protein
LIAYLKHELAANRERNLEEHLARCPVCRQELEKARRLLSWTEAASDEGSVRKVEEIINGAIEAGASDVHLDSQSDGGMIVRYRIDGVLSEVGRIESVQRYGVVARLKMIGEINVSETSVPQDGRFSWTQGGKDFNARLSSVPYVYGESLVIRLFVREECFLDWNEMGMYEDQIAAVRQLAHLPCGLVLLAGPTGCGKTTSAYTMLKEIASPQLNTLTIEDPVEAILKWVEQAQVRRATGFTYSKAVQAFMRQDPDVIYVGEINDTETADVCVKAAATGHMVISTISNPNAADAVKLMMNLSTHKHLVAFTLSGVIYQRLVRKVCENCGEQYEPESDDPAIKFLGISEEEIHSHTIRRGKGCEKCRHTGCHGRSGIFEVLTIDRDLCRMLGDRENMAEIIRAAGEKGFISMVEDAKRKVLAGLITPQEAMRVLL